MCIVFIRLSTLLILFHLGGKGQYCDFAEVMVTFKAAVVRCYSHKADWNVEMGLA